jgi:hypothetical protein
MYVQLKDEEVVELFVDHLRQNGHPGLSIDSCPEKTNRTTQDIEAIAGKYAIEHTRIDTVANQSRDSVRFVKALGDLEVELKEKVNFHLDVIFPYESIISGQNWPEINSAIKDFILFEAPKYSDGTHEIASAQNVPFSFYIRKNSKGENKLYFTRFVPDKDEYFGQLGEQINRKASKLKKYKIRPLTTVLLLESNDLALMNEAIMLDGLRNTLKLKLPEGVDQIWFVDTSIVEDILFYNLTDLITQKTI